MTDAQLTLRNMTITNGASAKGGAIYARGDLILEDVVVSGSSSTSTGGGIYAKQDLSLLRSSVTGNQATDNAVVSCHSRYPSLNRITNCR